MEAGEDFLPPAIKWYWYGVFETLYLFYDNNNVCGHFVAPSRQDEMDFLGSDAELLGKTEITFDKAAKPVYPETSAEKKLWQMAL